MITSRTSRIRAAALAGIPIAAIVLATLAPSAQADVDSVSASAFAATLQSSLLGNVIAPTPFNSGSATEPVNSFGPTQSSSLPVDVVGLLHVGVLNSRVEGDGVAAGEPAGHFGFSQARASVADVVVALGALSLDAIETQCKSDGTGSTGFTEIVGGVLGGNPLISSPIANTSLSVPGILTVTLNEQTIANSVGSTSIRVRGAHVSVLPGLLSLVGVVDIVLAETNCAATGPDVNVTPTTSTTTTTVAPTTTTTTTTVPTTTSTTSTTVVGATTTTSTTSTTTTTVAPAATTTTSTTIAPVVTVPPAGSTLPATTTTSTTIAPVAPSAPLPRTGTNSLPMVAIGFLAIALGVLVRRGGDSFLPVTESATALLPPPAPIRFHPVDARPSAARRRVRRNPLDAAARDALSAFDDDDAGQGS